MNEVIKVENLSKAYQLGEIGTGTLSQDLERFWAKIRKKEDPFTKIGEENDRATKNTSGMVWSLKDINFNVVQGDTIGIIGRNGAGKSTLLKILSRVTAPTSGSVKVKGRVASLLEVGTGFHPELSGRDNIFLNGVILGMRKAEIKRKFDEIVDFSGVERYIDTPVKRYSSGMYVRLAFAVAAHLESEILIVDEVLAVGDAEFQKKCLGKMGDINKGEGRTILFVSHNMSAINQLCANSILLKNGLLQKIGATGKVVDSYLSYYHSSEAYVNFDITNRIRVGNRKAQFKELYLRTAGNDTDTRIFSIGQSVEIYFSLDFNNPSEKTVRTSIELKTADGVRIANMIDVDSNFILAVKLHSAVNYRVTIHDIRLYPGTYYLSIYVGDTSSSEIYDYLEDCISFEIIDGGELTLRPLPKSAGLLFLTPEWCEI